MARYVIESKDLAAMPSDLGFEPWFGDNNLNVSTQKDLCEIECIADAKHPVRMSKKDPTAQGPFRWGTLNINKQLREMGDRIVLKFTVRVRGVMMGGTATVTIVRKSAAEASDVSGDLC